MRFKEWFYKENDLEVGAPEGPNKIQSASNAATVAKDFMKSPQVAGQVNQTVTNGLNKGRAQKSAMQLGAQAVKKAPTSLQATVQPQQVAADLYRQATGQDMQVPRTF